MNWTKPQQAPHTTQPLPFSALSLAQATAKPAEQEWSLPRKQLLELPQACAARGSGVCDMLLGSPDLHWHLGGERDQKLGFFKCRIPQGICGGINLNYLIRNYNSQEKHGNFHSSVHLDKCPVSRDRCSAGNPIMDNIAEVPIRRFFPNSSVNRWLLCYQT